MNNDFDFDDLVKDWIENEPVDPATNDDPEPDPVDDPEPTETPDDPEPQEPPVEDDKDDDADLDAEELTAAQVSFELLKEFQVLSVEDNFEFDGKPETLKDLLEKTKENLREESAKSLWESLPEEFKPLLQYGLAGGKNIQSYLDAYTQPDYEQMDLSSEDNQRRVMFDYWKLTSNYSPEKINRMIDALDKAGDLETEALTTASELSEIIKERQEQLVADAKKQEEQEKMLIKQQTEKITKVIENLPNVEKTHKNRLQTFMFTPVKYEEGYSTQLNRTINQITSNPEHFVQLADLLAQYNPDKGFSFEKIKSQLKTESNIKFKDIIDKLDSKSKVKGSTSPRVKDDFDWDSWMQNSNY